MTRLPRWSILFGALVGTLTLALSIMNIFASPPKTNAWTTMNYSWVFAPGSLDRFRNYDGGNPGYSTNVDWPIRYLWTNNAEIDKVKNRVDGCGGDPTLIWALCSSGGAKYTWMVLGTNGDFHDSDNGKKVGLSCSWDQHMRFYADSWNDRNDYNMTWGYYIVSSSHRDYEFLGQSLYCSNTYTSTEGSYLAPNESEYWWNVRLIDINSYVNPDWVVQTNTVYFANPETARWADGSHYVESNGWASVINVQ